MARSGGKMDGGKFGNGSLLINEKRMIVEKRFDKIEIGGHTSKVKGV